MPLKWPIPPIVSPWTGPASVLTTRVGSGTPGPCSVAPGTAAAFFGAPFAFAASAGEAAANAAPIAPRPMIVRLSSLFPLMMFPSQRFSLSFGVGGQLRGAAPLRQAVQRIHGV